MTTKCQCTSMTDHTLNVAKGICTGSFYDKRINVRDEWQGSKILGTLPWDGISDRTAFQWNAEIGVNEIARNLTHLSVHEFTVGDVTEKAYRANGVHIDVLRKLPGFEEKTDER